MMRRRFSNQRFDEQMHMIGHEAICQQAVALSIHAMNFIRNDLGNARLGQPMIAMLGAVEPFIVLPKVFLYESGNAVRGWPFAALSHAVV